MFLARNWRLTQDFEEIAAMACQSNKNAEHGAFE